jgi:hypothetical protein
MPKHIPVAVAVAAIACSIGAAAQQPPMPTNPTALANVRESKLYDELLRTNPSFRAKRMQIECGPINDPQLHASCVASFQAYGPTPPPTMR